MFIGQHSGSGTPSIDDILNYTQCKLLMPFTVNLNDHSAYAHQVNNTEVILGENGAVFNGSSAYLKVPKLINEWSSDWTCEFIITCPNTAISESDLIIDARNNGSGWMIRINSGYVDVVPTNGNTAYYAKAPLANNETAHIAATKRGSIFSIYKNGEFVQSCSDTRTLSVPTTWNIGKNNATNNYYLKGTLGGFRFINRVLSPSEFNLTRPFKIPEINFKQGNKTYLFKEGILDSRITLTSAFSIVDGHITSTGNVSFEFSTDGIEEKKIMVRSSPNPAVAASNDGTRLHVKAMNGSTTVTDQCVVFAGGSSKYCTVEFGIDLSNKTGFDRIRISTACLNNQIWIDEIWYE